MTIVDSLDTMYLMGLHDEFGRGVAFVNHIDFQLAVCPLSIHPAHNPAHNTRLICPLRMRAHLRLYSRQSSELSEVSYRPTHSRVNRSS